MTTFQPPTVEDVPRVLPDTRGAALLLMCHYSPLPRGRSVIWESGHFVTRDEPDSTGRVEGVDLFLGGHVYTISDAMAAVLTADGYGSYIT